MLITSVCEIFFRCSYPSEFHWCRVNVQIHSLTIRWCLMINRKTPLHKVALHNFMLLKKKSLIKIFVVAVVFVIKFFVFRNGFDTVVHFPGSHDCFNSLKALSSLFCIHQLTNLLRLTGESMACDYGLMVVVLFLFWAEMFVTESSFNGFKVEIEYLDLQWESHWAWPLTSQAVWLKWTIC